VCVGGGGLAATAAALLSACAVHPFFKKKSLKLSRLPPPRVATIIMIVSLFEKKMEIIYIPHTQYFFLSSG
jgi:hypothetical protein